MRAQSPSDATVLVVDDDQRVRDIAVTMLENEGFKVLEANNASTALQLFVGNPEIHLVFSDVIMPGRMSGVEMVKEMIQKNPRTKVILVTGYRDKAAALKEGLGYSNSVCLITKPYDVEEVSDLVKKMIFDPEFRPPVMGKIRSN